jgi:hypothetical protein
MRAAGIIEEDGHYVLKTNRDYGLEVGEYVVTVAAREPGIDKSDGAPPMPGPYLTPRHYAIGKTSGLTFSVTKGSNEINIDLSSEVRKSDQRPRRRR